MRLLLILFTLAISLPSQAAVEISNFRSGLACTETRLSHNSDGWICQPTEDVLVTDQGVCIFNGAKKPCTWIGFEFDYKGASNNTTLHCTSETSAPVSSGNPNELIAADAKSQSYELALKPGAGHFFNPQYFVYHISRKGNEALIDTGRCMVENRVIFEYKFNIRFPTAAE